MGDGSTGFVKTGWVRLRLVGDRRRRERADARATAAFESMVAGAIAAERQPQPGGSAEQSSTGPGSRQDVRRPRVAEANTLIDYYSLDAGTVQDLTQLALDDFRVVVRVSGSQSERTGALLRSFVAEFSDHQVVAEETEPNVFEVVKASNAGQALPAPPSVSESRGFSPTTL